MKGNIRFVFFGTSHIAVYVLEALAVQGFTPSAVVTMPDRPRGRGMEMSAPAVKMWAAARGIEMLQPDDLQRSHILENMGVLSPDVGVVVDYGKILPKELLDVPRRGFLNVHPSLLPRLRGASPIRSAILHDENPTGVTVMQIDEKMDHGPIIAQKKVEVQGWPVKNSELERILMQEGGALLAQVLPHWIAGEIEAREQNHDLATYCEKISKDDGLLDLNDDARRNLLKIRAFEGWPGTFAYFENKGKKVRVKIIDAHLEGGALAIDRVVPEGRREMSYSEFLKSGAKPAI
jgi:methionyl-tRNA formyltransferase